jgi:hypothetical protein
MMSPSVRKLALTAHVVCSVGWLGAVAAFLALAIAGLVGNDVQVMLAANIAMKLTAWYVIVPIAFAALATGIVQSLGTQWGLLRHYWVVTKLVLTILATVVLLLKMALIDRVAATTALSDLRDGRTELVAHAAGGVVVLVAIAGLSVFKPWGKTLHGRRAEPPVTDR